METLGQLVQSGLGFLLTALKQDPNAHVKDTTAWTIGGWVQGRGEAGWQAGGAACGAVSSLRCRWLAVEHAGLLLHVTHYLSPSTQPATPVTSRPHL